MELKRGCEPQSDFELWFRLGFGYEGVEGWDGEVWLLLCEANSPEASLLCCNSSFHHIVIVYASHWLRSFGGGIRANDVYFLLGRCGLLDWIHSVCVKFFNCITFWKSGVECRDLAVACLENVSAWNQKIVVVDGKSRAGARSNDAWA